MRSKGVELQGMLAYLDDLEADIAAVGERLEAATNPGHQTAGLHRGRW